MRIGLVAPVALAIPPAGYGGTELVVSQLAEGLTARGHDVTLFASGDSRTAATLRALHPRALEADGPMARADYDAAERAHVEWAFDQAEALGLDLLHDHTKAAGVLAAHRTRVPVVTTVHNDFTPARREVYGAHPNHRFVAISRAHAARMPELPFAGVVYNGIDLAPTTFRAKKDGYVLFLGRLDEPKGADRAARVCAALDLPLVMAGRTERERDFFDAEVAPHLDGTRRRYVGEVTGQAKWDLYAGASALLFPIRWEEPFGLVMIEAMACGTPVVATGWGSVPEVVADGETGIVVARDADDAALGAALKAAEALDPAACRARVERLFSTDRMVEAYASLYETVLTGRSAKSAAIAGP